VPYGFTSFHFPAAKWIVFDVKGPAPTAFVDAWRQIFSEWLPSNGYALAELPAIEAYISLDVYSPDALNEIWLAVK
jgi:AraC family transcriptional regulator